MTLATAAVVSMLAAAPALEADIRAVAALPGEPRIVAAAGVLKDETPVLTLENPDAFDAASTKRRVVVFATGATPATSEAVVRMVRWFKTAAPTQLRDQWSLSALPVAQFDPADTKSMSRWMNFQAPDLVIEIVDGDARPTGPGNVDTFNAVIRVPAPDDALGSMLRATRSGRAPVRDTMLARVSRAPLDIARLLARRYPEAPGISYIPSIAWVQTLRLASIVNDDALRAKVVEQTKPWTSGEKKLFGDRIQLTSVAGTMIFDELHANALFDEGVAAAAKEKAPAEPEYGQGWTDDMFMAASILARSGIRPGHERDMDAAARLLTTYAARLQQPNGLFNHATNGPVAWGRGNGFAAFGLIEVLTRMPASHPSRAPLVDIYRRQMAGVRAQLSPDGSWRQIIDEPGAYREETATAMLMTAMARGIRLGWLDVSFRPAVDRAWRALAAHVADDGTLIDVCSGTGAGPTKRYYFDRPAVTGADDRGGAMALLAAMEIYDLTRAR
jgi:unsaturated rhamnogalacturonyl hydrolase